MSAVQILKKEGDKYCFDMENFESILDCSKNNLVAIYSITGPLRSGKSFMLSFFLKYLLSEGKPYWIQTELKETFKYRGGTETETSGIWMWSEPFLRKINGTIVSIFLLDTQGCFNNMTTTSDNAIVFALSALLSSCMIFNLKSQIDEGILQFLQYFAGFARMADDQNKGEPFQKLVYLLRDWEFTDYEPGYYDDSSGINGMNYKIDHLNPNDKQSVEMKFTHESILATFEHVSCYLLPHPGKAVSKNSIFNLETVDPVFLEHVQNFVPLILKDENINIKMIGGHELTGQQLIRFVKKWEAIFKSDVMPKSKSLFQTSVALKNELAMAASIENYTRDIIKFVNGQSNEQFVPAHKLSQNESINVTKREFNIKIEECERLSAELDKKRQDFNQLKSNSEEEKKKFEEIMKRNQDKLDRCMGEMENARVEKEKLQEQMNEMINNYSSMTCCSLL